ILTFQDLKKSDYWRHFADTVVLLATPLMISRVLVHLFANILSISSPMLSQLLATPLMNDVVRTEVLKLLAAGIIYPIADSKWVSPVHCVPKKGGMTVVPNDKNELIPQRIV